MIAQIVWHAPQYLAGLVAVAVAMGVIVIWLYQPQIKSASMPWRWALPLLRAMALGTLILSALKPVMLRAKSRATGQAVLVLIDGSSSMGIGDNTRSPAEQVALADALGMLPQGVRTTQGSDHEIKFDELNVLLEQAAQAGVDLDYATRISGQGESAARARLRELVAKISATAQQIGEADLKLPADAPQGDFGKWISEARHAVAEARSVLQKSQAARDEQLYQSTENVRKICADLGKQSRLALTEKVITGPGGVLAELQQQFPVSRYVYAHGLRQQEIPAEANGNQSPLQGALAQMLKESPSRDVRAAVLFSDGRQVAAANEREDLSLPDVPVFTVSAAASDPPRDLSFARIAVPNRAYAGEQIVVAAKVRATGIKDETVEVHLADGNFKTSQILKVIAGAAPVAQFTLDLKEPGVHKIGLSLAPVSGEVSTANNQVERWVKVLPQKLRVAAIAGSFGWDFQYLRRSLQSASAMQVTTELLDPDQPAVKLQPQEILSQDVVILSDVPVSALTDAQWDALYRLVNDQGGSVILIAGAHLPSTYGGQVLAANLMPFVPTAHPAWRTWPGDHPSFRFVPTADGEQSEALRLDGETDANRQRWRSLSGFFRFMPIAQSDLKPNARGLLVETESRASNENLDAPRELYLLTESRIGLGRVFFFGGSETWRWRWRGEDAQDRFWLQLVRYASEEPYLNVKDGIALDLDRVAIQPFESIHVRARVPHGAAEDLGITISREGAVVQRKSLPRQRAIAGGRYSTVVSGLPAGDYIVRLTTRSASQTTLEVPLHVAANREAEMSDLSGDEQFLHRLAESSGGQFLKLADVRTLPHRLRSIRQTGPQFTEERLWDSPYLFIFVVGCLGAEWAIRKQVGLA